MNITTVAPRSLCILCGYGPHPGETQTYVTNEEGPTRILVAPCTACDGNGATHFLPLHP